MGNQNSSLMNKTIKVCTDFSTYLAVLLQDCRLTTSDGKMTLRSIFSRFESIKTRVNHINTIAGLNNQRQNVINGIIDDLSSISSDIASVDFSSFSQDTISIKRTLMKKLGAIQRVMCSWSQHIQKESQSQRWVTEASNIGVPPVSCGHQTTSTPQFRTYTDNGIILEL